jgi:hypothetical protein
VPDIVIRNDLVIHNLVTVMHLLQLMIQLCMKAYMDDDEIEQLEMIIRMFLTKFDHVDAMLKNQEKIGPTWISSYNFLCILNIPNMIRRYGSLRHIWEGGECGEGFIRKVKRELKTGLRNNWRCWVMTNLLRNISYHDLFQQLNNDTKCNQHVEYKVYSNKMFAKFLIAKNRPISGMCLVTDDEPNKYFICFRMENQIYGWELNVSYDSYVIEHNVKYHYISYSENVVCIDSTITKRTWCYLSSKTV